MKKSGSAIVWFAFAAGLVAASPALAAGPAPENVATGRELYKQGADALDAGDAKTAVQKLTAAWALVQTPVIGFDLARAHVKLAKLVEAREAALAVVRLPVAANETARSTQARHDADALAAQLAPRIPHLKLSISGLDARHSANVKLDGTAVPEAALSVALQVNPGAHTAMIDTDDGRHAEGAVTVAEAETKEITLSLPAPSETHPPQAATTPATSNTPVSSAATAAPPATPPAAEEPPRKGLSPVVWIGIGVTAAGFAMGAVAGAFALASTSTVQANCTVKGSDGLFICGPAYTGDLSSAQTASTISTIGFIGAGVGVAILVTGLVLSATSRPSEKHARIVPLLGPVTGLAGTF